MAAQTLYDKLSQAHAVFKEAGDSTLLYIDCQLVHEVTLPQAFEGLRLAGCDLWRSDDIVWPPTTLQPKNLISSRRRSLVGEYARKLKRVK